VRGVKLKRYILRFQIFFLIFLIVSAVSLPQDWYSNLNETQKELYTEHLKFGQPNNEVLLIRNAYVLYYNSNYRIPNWVAYHIDPDYLNVPERKGKFAKFRTDGDVEDPVKDSEYDGLYSTKGYARGHLAPYKIMGGDRDLDGEYAALGNGVTSDPDDELTIFQGNYLTNIAPQHQNALNGPGGPWYKLERWIQDVVVAENRREVWVYAGCIIFDTEHIEGVGKNDSIVVPNLFYKIVIMESGNSNQPYVLAFLFPHFKNKNDIKETNIFKYLVAVDYIEALTRLDFFKNIDISDQEVLESQIEMEPWTRYIRD
jgi:endonuclease G